MKKILLSIFLSVITTIGLSGCYTIIWSPDSEFPTQDNSDYTTIYYSPTYYGPYYGWYDVPWWYDYAPPVTVPTGDRTHETVRLRDTDGRVDPPRVPDVQPPSRNDPGTGDNTNKGSSGDTTNKDSGRSSSSDSGNSNGSGNSSSSGSTRNNDGGRSSGGRR